jgi:hypothetical protein
MHWSLSIDEFAEEVFIHLERGQDGGARHYARFTADNRASAVDRAVACLRELVEKKIYASDDYGYPAEASK